MSKAMSIYRRANALELSYANFTFSIFMKLPFPSGVAALNFC